MRASYRRKLGVPKSMSFDPLPLAVDDEYGYTITRLRITRRSR